MTKYVDCEIDLNSLPKKKRDFFLKTAGIFKFKKPINIKKVYKTKIYD